jgi:Domain of unknown function (DUF1707)
MTDVISSWWHPAMVPTAGVYDIRYCETAHDGTIQEGGSPVNATRGNNLPAEMRASDSDRDAVVSDLSEHFQAGRLTAGEFGERMGRALAARTWGELRNLLADLPAARPGTAATAVLSAGPRRFAPPRTVALAGIVIAVVVLVNVAHDGWGFVWLLLPGLLVARRLIWCGCAPRRSEQKS